MRVENARHLIDALQALRVSSSSSSSSSSSKEQTQTQRNGGGGGLVCMVCLSSEGIHIQWDDETKSLQSQILVRKDSFSDIYVHHSVEASRLTFGMYLNQLADTLSLFSTLQGETPGGLVLRYPNQENQLEIETTTTTAAADSSVAVEAEVEANTYAKLSTLEAPQVTDWLDHWEGPDTSFHVPTGLLREAVEDLEWSGGSVTLSITREPPQVQFLSCQSTGISSASASNGTLSVRLPESEVSGLQCALDHVSHDYNYKRLKKTLALGNHHQALSKEGILTSILTKVSVSAQGTLKVMHMINTTRNKRDQQLAGMTLYRNGSYFEASQHGNAAALGQTSVRTGIVQYVLYPNCVA